MLSRVKIPNYEIGDNETEMPATVTEIPWNNLCANNNYIVKSNRRYIMFYVFVIMTTKKFSNHEVYNSFLFK
jgi:hypothetical protein